MQWFEVEIEVDFFGKYIRGVSAYIKLAKPCQAVVYKYPQRIFLSFHAHYLFSNDAFFLTFP